MDISDFKGVPLLDWMFGKHAYYLNYKTNVPDLRFLLSGMLVLTGNTVIAICSVFSNIFKNIGTSKKGPVFPGLFQFYFKHSKRSHARSKITYSVALFTKTFKHPVLALATILHRNGVRSSCFILAEELKNSKRPLRTRFWLIIADVRFVIFEYVIGCHSLGVWLRREIKSCFDGSTTLPIWVRLRKNRRRSQKLQVTLMRQRNALFSYEKEGICILVFREGDERERLWKSV